MLEILPHIASFMDEPFADYSTFYADKLARIYQKFPHFFKQTLGFFVNHLPVSHRDMSFDFKAKQFLYGSNFESVLRNQVWLGSFHFGEQKKLFVESTQLKDPLLLVKEVLN